jgi:hypothetical protein
VGKHSNEMPLSEVIAWENTQEMPLSEIHQYFFFLILQHERTNCANSTKYAAD